MAPAVPFMYTGPPARNSQIIPFVLKIVFPKAFLAFSGSESVLVTDRTVISREDDDHLVPHIFRFDRRREVSDGRVRKVDHRVVCLQKNGSFISTFPMCVPSLSWQMSAVLL